MINAVNEFLDDLRGGRMTETPVVTVEQGQLAGRIATTVAGKNYYSFQGIPYAKPPLGSLRFKAPEPAEPWEGIRDATSEGNVSSQIDMFKTKQYIGDENCLFLNISTPNLDGAFLPVMVYLHGGGLTIGSGNTEDYGPDYLIEKDVVVVTLNYRLGALGFLCLNTPEVPGNAGAKDVVLALRWIKENIGSFGGNAGNLTVFGESAGGALVSLLTVSPAAKNLISKAIIQSGSALCPWSFQKDPIANAVKLAKLLGCESENVEEIAEFLRSTPAKDLIEAQAKLGFEIDNHFTFVAAVEKEFPNEESIVNESFLDYLTSGRVAPVPTMIGTTTLEITTEKPFTNLEDLVPEELTIEKGSDDAKTISKEIERVYFKGNRTDDSKMELYQLFSDIFFVHPTHRHITYLLHNTSASVFYYKFDYVGQLNLSPNFPFSLGLKAAMHTDELGYLFVNDLQKDAVPTEDDLRTRERMVRLWTNFAKTGNPTSDDSHYIKATWPPATKDEHFYLNISNELTVKSNPDQEKMQFWDELYSRHFKIWKQQAHSSVKDDSPKTIGSFTEDTEPSFIEKSPKDQKESYTENTESFIDNSSRIIENVTRIVTNSENVTVAESSVTSVTYTENTFTEGERIVTETVMVASEVPENGDTKEKIEQIIVKEPEIVEETPKVASPKEASEVDASKTESHKVDISFFEAQKVENHVSNGFEKKVEKARTSNEIKMVQNSNGVPKDVIRANDPPEDDLPKNIGVNKFVNFFESLGGKK